MTDGSNPVGRAPSVVNCTVSFTVRPCVVFVNTAGVAIVTVNAPSETFGLTDSLDIPLTPPVASALHRIATVSTYALVAASLFSVGVGTIGDSLKVHGAVIVSFSSLLGFLSQT